MPLCGTYIPGSPKADICKGTHGAWRRKLEFEAQEGIKDKEWMW